MRTIPPRQMTQFLSELATLLQPGTLSPLQALKIIQQAQPNQTLFKLIVAIQHDLDKGQSLAESLANYPQHLEPFLIDLLKTDQSLSTSLADIASYREAMESSTTPLTKRLMIALSYFLVVILFFLMVTAFLLIYVVPVFQDMFSSFGGALPPPTQWVVSLSEMGKTYWQPLVLMGLLGGFFPWRQPQRVISYIPFVGRLYRDIALIRFLRTCAFLLTHQIPLPRALEASAQVVHFPPYAKILRQLSQQMATGTPFTEALLTHPKIPLNIVHAVLIGTEVNQLDTFLMKQANMYAEQVQLAIDPAIRALSILLTILVGIVIGLFVVAMYGPIFYLAEAV